MHFCFNSHIINSKIHATCNQVSLSILQLISAQKKYIATDSRNNMRGIIWFYELWRSARNIKSIYFVFIMWLVPPSMLIFNMFL